jgi:hypothetical protein
MKSMVRTVLLLLLLPDALLAANDTRRLLLLVLAPTVLPPCELHCRALPAAAAGAPSELLAPPADWLD